MDTLAELANRAQDRIFGLDAELDFLNSKDDNLTEEIIALDLKLLSMRQEKIQKAMDLKIAEKAQKDTEEALSRFIAKQKALASKFDPLPEDPTPSRAPQVGTKKPDIFRQLSGNVEDSSRVLLPEQTQIEKTFEGSSFGESDENAPIQRLVRNN